MILGRRCGLGLSRGEGEGGGELKGEDVALALLVIGAAGKRGLMRGVVLPIGAAGRRGLMRGVVLPMGAAGRRGCGVAHRSSWLVGGAHRSS
jgi:hypothetical protein